MRTSDFLYGLLSLKGVGNVKAAKISKAFARYLQWDDYTFKYLWHTPKDPSCRSQA